MVEVKGGIEVVCGPMFCGKSEELIRRLVRAEFAKLRVQAFKPTIDGRYGEDDAIQTHQRGTFPCIRVTSVGEMATAVRQDTQVVGVDEGQFFDATLIEFCERCANSGIRVIVAGLDQDYQGKPFGPMPYLMARADRLTKLDAICVACGDRATKSFRKVRAPDPLQFVVGEKDAYEAMCRDCFHRAMGEKAGHGREP